MRYSLVVAATRRVKALFMAKKDWAAKLGLAWAIGLSAMAPLKDANSATVPAFEIFGSDYTGNVANIGVIFNEETNEFLFDTNAPVDYIDTTRTGTTLPSWNYNVLTDPSDGSAILDFISGGPNAQAGDIGGFYYTLDPSKFTDQLENLPKIPTKFEGRGPPYIYAYITDNVPDVMSTLTPVPVPATLPLLGSALMMLPLVCRSRRSD